MTFLTMRFGGVFPLTLDLTRLYAGVSTVLILATMGLAAYGCYASRGNEPLFGRAPLD